MKYRFLCVFITLLVGCGENAPTEDSQLPVVVMRLDGKKIEPGRFYKDGLRIVEPKPGARFVSGQPIRVVAEPINGYQPKEVWFQCQDGRRDVSTPPFAAELTVHPRSVGNMTVCANATDAQNNITTAQPVEIVIDPPSSLTALVFDLEPNAVALNYIPARNLVVIGKFADGIDRNLQKRGLPLIYTIENPRIATVDHEGVLRYASPGKTRVTVSYGGHSVTSDVFAGETLEQTQALIKAAQSP